MGEAIGSALPKLDRGDPILKKVSAALRQPHTVLRLC